MKYTKRQLTEMSLKELKETAYKLAVTYYNSDKCIISFGNNSPNEVARKLVAVGSRATLTKDILSLQRKIAC